MSSSWDIFFLSSSKTVGSPDFLSASMGIYSYSVFSGIPPLLHLVLNQISMVKPYIFFPLNQDFIWAPCFKCYDFLTSPFEYLTYIANSPSLQFLFPIPQVSLNLSLLQSSSHPDAMSTYRSLTYPHTHCTTMSYWFCLQNRLWIPPFLTISINDKATLYVQQGYCNSLLIILPLLNFSQLKSISQRAARVIS